MDQDAPSDATARRSPARRGRDARRAARLAASEVARPCFVRRNPPVSVLDEESLAIIEANADRILAEVGIEVRDYPRAKELFKAAGCDVDELGTPADTQHRHAPPPRIPERGQLKLISGRVRLGPWSLSVAIKRWAHV